MEREAGHARIGMIVVALLVFLGGIALEQGKYLPSLALAFRLAQVFGVPIEEVFGCRD